MKKKFYQSSNFWHSLITLLSSVFVALNVETIAAAHNLVDAATADTVQWAAVIQSGYTVMNMVYQLFIKPKNENPPTLTPPTT